MMIKQISTKTKKDILKKLVEIHKLCILETNSKYYDSEQIKEWISSVNIKNIQEQLTNSSWIIVKEKETIVGFAQYCLNESEIYQIQILPQYQGKGYGRELYRYIEKEFRDKNIATISLYSTLNAVSFYEKVGFKKIKNIKFNLSKTKVEMIEMKKSF